MASFTTQIVQRSWADVVSGGSRNESSKIENTWQRLKPAARGTLRCFCRGEVLTMLSHYGWLMAYGDIDHPAAEKHDGHVYVSRHDLAKETTLVVGDVVTFYLYVDEKGLGAEQCCIESSKDASRDDQQIATPTFIALPPIAAPAQPTLPNKAVQFAKVFKRLAQVFVEDDDDDEAFDIESKDGDYLASCDFQAIVSSKRTSKMKRAASPDGSTSAGTCSDSEGESSCDSFPISPRKVLNTSSPTFRPPPGLTLDHFYPPPGLSLA